MDATGTEAAGCLISEPLLSTPTSILVPPSPFVQPLAILRALGMVAEPLFPAIVG